MLAVIVCLALAASASAVCGSSSGPADSADSKLQIVTTLYPLEYFASRVGGDRVDVVNLVGPGVEAHDFEPSTGDMRTMSEADIVVYNGRGFEPWMDRAISSLDDSEITVVELGAALGESPDAVDPHFWLDPLLARKQTEAISASLSSAAPPHAAEFRRNADAVLADLDALHDEYVSGLADCRLNTFVAAHSAFGHMASRYGLDQVSVSGLSPEAEPSPSRLAELTRDIKATGVKYVMTESASTRGLTQTIAEEIDAGVLRLHSLESLTPDEADNGVAYLDIMRDNLVSLRTALECS